MKVLLSALCGFVLCTLILASPAFIQPRKHIQLGLNECTWGPSYWCSNITNAKGCNAVSHCIKAVWEKQTVPEDNDSVCKICLDMVQQARDQLESNETQEDIRAVFEGSCKLLYIKEIVKGCIKLADNFIPEMVEALASQMNPQMVCSVAGLCNNARIDQLLAEMPQIEDMNAGTVLSYEDPPKDSFTCEKCNKISNLISAKFQTSDRDTVLENMLTMCGRLSSFSDSCSNLVLLNFNEIYEQLDHAMDSEKICHMSGVCASKYHQHSDRPAIVEIETKSDIGFLNNKEDIPCELCEQLVKHLRDLLIANTTESEFKMVLQGLCNQTQGFRKECNSIVDQYYDVIYHSLVNDLDANGACFLIGICPKGLEDRASFMPVMSKLPVNTLEVTITEKPKRKLLGAHEPKFTHEEIQSFQLPFDTLQIRPGRLVGNEEGNNQLCTICELFLHFLQDALADTKNEAKIKKEIALVCDRIPKGIQDECRAFVNNYGDAILALCIQDIDPRQMCPMLHMCPKPADIKVTIITESETSDNPKCPLCLFAVTEAQTVIKSDKSKTNIKKTLNNLCKHLSPKLRMECNDFIETYTSQLIDLLAKDFTPDQICAQIKLCTETDTELDKIVYGLSDEQSSNEIFDNTVNGQVIPMQRPDVSATTPNCMLCMEVVKLVEKRLVKKHTKEEIKNELKHVCDKMAKMRTKCIEFVEKHGDDIAELILQELTPKEICHQMLFCSEREETREELERYISLEDDTKVNDFGVTDSPCVLCEFLMVKLEDDIKNAKTQAEIKTAVENVCRKMPKTISNECVKFVDQYSALLIQLLESVPPKMICTKLGLCKGSLVEVFDVHRNLATADLIECAVCTSATESLKNLQLSMTDDEMILADGCSRVPAKYHSQCVELVEPYGISLLNLIRRGEERTACSSIGKCFVGQYVALADLE